MQRFYFLNFERRAVLLNVVSNVQVLKNIAFEKECSNIKLTNMALSKQQLAGKLVKKTVSLDEKVKFLDFAKGNPTLGCRKLAEISKSEKLPQPILLKKRKTFAVSMNYFMKNLRNEIALANTEKLMRSYTSGTRDVVLLTFNPMDQC